MQRLALISTRIVRHYPYTWLCRSRVGGGLEKGFHALGLRLGVVGQRLAALAIAEPGNPARAQADGAMLALRLHLFFLDGLERLPGFLGCAEKIVRRIDRVQVAGSNGRAARLDSFQIGRATV